MLDKTMTVLDRIFARCTVEDLKVIPYTVGVPVWDGAHDNWGTFVGGSNTGKASAPGVAFRVLERR